MTIKAEEEKSLEIYVNVDKRTHRNIKCYSCVPVKYLKNSENADHRAKNIAIHII